LIENNKYMKAISILVILSLIVLGCLSCSQEAKGLKEEIRLLKEENNFLKAENIGLKKELEKLYKKLDENINDQEKGEIKLKPETKGAEKQKDNIKVEQNVKKKPR